MTKIVLIGGGGHARVVMDLLSYSREHEVAGVLDPGLEAGEAVSVARVLGDDTLLGSLYEDGVREACVAIGSVGDNSRRRELYLMVKGQGFSVPPLVHPLAAVSSGAALSEGCQIMAGTIIQTGSAIGENTIVNTGAIIDHDCRIGSHVHLCPGAVISGGCSVEDGVFIGAGATIIQGLRIGRNSKIGAGSVVIADVPENAVVKGVPAK